MSKIKLSSFVDLPVNNENIIIHGRRQRGAGGAVASLGFSNMVQI